MVDRSMLPSRFQAMFPGKADPNDFLTPFDPGAAGIGTLIASAGSTQMAKEGAKSVADSARFVNDAVYGNISPYAFDPETGETIPNPAWTAGSMETALNVATPSFGSTALRSAAGKDVMDPNTLGIFASTGAATADKAKLALAEDMLAKGASRDEIIDATGWFKGRDGKWRFEIKDTEARIKELPDEVFGAKTLGEVLDHPEFFKAYPGAASASVVRSPKEAYRLDGARGSYHRNEIDIASELQDPRSTLLHEMQHLVQDKEGLSYGTNTKAMTPYGQKKYEAALPVKSDNVSEEELRQRIKDRVYLLTHGEVEPRNVQTRLEKGYDQRPWDTLDVPEDFIIYRDRDALEEGVKGYNQGGLVSSMPMTQYLNALGTIESGNNYSALGPRTEKGNQAYGRYQVMDFNIPVWTKEVLGQEMTPQQFLRDKEAQDAVAGAKFGQYVEQYGNPYDAASMWFSGRPMDRAGNASDVTGTSVPQYVSRFANALGMPMEQNAEGIAALNAEELALARERMNLDQGPSNRDRRRMISALTDFYESTLPKQADFSLLRRRG